MAACSGRPEGLSRSRTSVPVAVVGAAKVRVALNGTKSVVIQSPAAWATPRAISRPVPSRSETGNEASKYQVPRAMPLIMSGLVMSTSGTGAVTRISGWVVSGDGCTALSGQGANSQAGGTRPTEDPSGQSLASMVQNPVSPGSPSGCRSRMTSQRARPRTRHARVRRAYFIPSLYPIWEPFLGVDFRPAACYTLARSLRKRPLRGYVPAGGFFFLAGLAPDLALYIIQVDDSSTCLFEQDRALLDRSRRKYSTSDTLLKPEPNKRSIISIA